MRFQSVRQVVESAPSVYDADDTVYVFALVYRFRVLEYLKGAGAAEVVGVTRTVLPKYSTRQEAEASTEDFISKRDTRWDNREAVVFLAKTLNWTRPHSTNQADWYTLGFLGDGRYPDDNYTLSNNNKLWLPAASATGGSAFLMDDPASIVSGEAPTITLAALKAEIAAVETEVAAGDGTEAYRRCVWRKYGWERREQFAYDANRWTPRRIEVRSGQAPSETLQYETGINRGPNVQYWLEGQDAAIFTIPSIGRIQAVRPLPAGEYEYMYLDRMPVMNICDAYPEVAKKRSRRIMVAAAPAGVLHEAFFDPVAVGNTVAADGSNGVLKPVAFTASDGASATLHSIVWEPPSTGSAPGSVKVKVVPWSSLPGVLDFIELDGTVSTSLNLGNSTVHTGTDTLVWKVSSQPWEDGDKLMVRIRRAAPFAPVPTGLTATASGADEIGLSWDPVTGATGYRVQRRESGQGSWATVDSAVMETTHTVSGLSCGTSYEFRVGAYGDGTRYERIPGPRGYATASATTSACTTQRPPAFDSGSYSFEVSEDAATGAEVGTVSATDPDGDTVSYSITAGNDAGVFAVGASTGTITVAAELDYESVSSYTLTVQADDGGDGTGTASVEIGVTDVLDTLPPAPGGLSASLSEGGFLLSWDAVSGADLYEAQHRVGGATEAAWTSLDAAASTSATFNPAGGPACGTTYEFRVRARGDGAAYAADWGEASATASVTTGACNRAPVFGAAAYSFSIDEDASVGSKVGTVSATDPDAGDTVTYSITAGNDAGKFAVGGSTGVLTLAGTLDYDTAASYTLTVRASDGGGGTATATVTVGVVEAAAAGSPVFGAGAYAFSVIEGASVGSTVGAVSATDPDEGDTVAYSITSGNEAGKFSMASDTGRITLAGTLDHATASSYTLTVQASDGKGGRGTAGVTVSVELASCSNGTAVASPSANPKLVEDCVTLLSARDALEGTVVLNWSSDTPIARWKGVGVAGTPVRVRSLSLSGLGLDGTVPSGLGDLSKLRKLYLRGNELTGTIPSELGGLSGLEELVMAENALTGSIPAGLGGLGRLHRLSLGENQLTGSIPASLARLSNLRTIDLAENGLSGTIPTGLGGLAQLRYLSLGGNSLTGSVPTELGSLSKLQYLYLDQNALTGGIPAQLGSLADLEVLSLYGNGLTGAIPSELGSLSKLEELVLNRNGLTGSIPPELESLSNLAYLTLSGNKLTGCIPAGLRDVETNDLDRLDLAYCS